MVIRVDNSPTRAMIKKRKREFSPIGKPRDLKPIYESPQRKKTKAKKVKSAPPILQKEEALKSCSENLNVLEEKEAQGIIDKISSRYPVLEDQNLVQKFLSVPMTNNQKGRIRQVLKDSLKGTAEILLPDVIHAKILSILKSSEKLSDSDLRKIRLLYNMLRTALQTDNTGDSHKNKNKTNKKTSKPGDTEVKLNEEKVTKKDVKTEQGDVKKSTKSIGKKKGTEQKKVVIGSSKDTKPKGPKRYVVFVGNLPPDINKEKIIQHFSEFNECIVDIRIPKRPENKKSSIAYVELKNEPTYELALSKHHSMLGSKRINVLYTTQKNGKITKAEAKSKSAKMIALQKAGKLMGSIPVNRKRSYRRMKMKKAQAKLAAESS